MLSRRKNSSVIVACQSTLIQLEASKARMSGALDSCDAAAE